MIKLEAYKHRFIEHAAGLLNFNGSAVLEVGCGDGVMTREIAHRYSPGLIVGIDCDLDFWSVSPQKKDNWEIACGDALDMDYPEKFFDIVISVGTFEHISDPGKCLAEIRRVLKPGGRFYTEFAPVWTSVVGHHYNFWIEKDAVLVPPWGHLLMEEAAMLAHMEPLVGGQEAQRAAFGIYRDSSINRWTRADYYSAFLSSGLWIRHLKEYSSSSRLSYFGRQDCELTPEIFDRLKHRHGLQDLLLLGFEALFEKHPQR